MSHTNPSALIPSQLSWELLSFLENTRQAVEACGRAVELAREAGREDLALALLAWRSSGAESISRLRTAVGHDAEDAESASRPAGEDGLRDVVEEASVESFPASDPPAY